MEGYTLLRIIKATDPIIGDRLLLVLYGSHGVGRTSLACSADTPLLLDFEGGADWESRKGSRPIKRWSDVASINARDVEDYKTIVVDPTERALDLLKAHLVAGNSSLLKEPNKMSLRGFGAMKNHFTGWLRCLAALGKDVILVVHTRERKLYNRVLQRLDLPRGCHSEICKSADAIARLYKQDGKRLLSFPPTADSLGKDPASLGGS
jgi:hypothetical protein